MSLQWVIRHYLSCSSSQTFLGCRFIIFFRNTFLNLWLTLHCLCATQSYVAFSIDDASSTKIWDWKWVRVPLTWHLMLFSLPSFPSAFTILSLFPLFGPVLSLVEKGIQRYEADPYDNSIQNPNAASFCGWLCFSMSCLLTLQVAVQNKSQSLMETLLYRRFWCGVTASELLQAQASLKHFEHSAWGHSMSPFDLFTPPDLVNNPV